MDGAHGLHGNNALLRGSVKHASRLAGVGNEGLLDQHVLSRENKRQGLGSMSRIGRAYVDGVGIRGGAQVLKRVEGEGPAVLLGERSRAGEIPRIGARVFGAIVGGEGIKEPLTNAARSNRCDTNALPLGHNGAPSC